MQRQSVTFWPTSKNLVCRFFSSSSWLVCPVCSWTLIGRQWSYIETIQFESEIWDQKEECWWNPQRNFRTDVIGLSKHKINLDSFITSLGDKRHQKSSNPSAVAFFWNLKFPQIESLKFHNYMWFVTENNL